MDRFIARYALAAIIAAWLVAPGCQKKAAVPATASTAVKQATPEESFALIIETFRRGVEDVPIGFMVHDESGRQTLMTGRNEVSHELIKPAKEGDPYKAIITVKSQSHYSLQQSQPSTPSASTSQPANDQSADDGSGVEVIDPSVVTTPNANQPKFDPKAKPVAQQQESHEQKYELVYENGRWKLITKLDPKIEGAIQLAFDRAIDSQG
jgi:hypothetical protein